MKRILFYLILVCASCNFLQAQNINAIKSRCSSPNTSFYGSVLVQRDGNINATPCPTKSFQINGSFLAGDIFNSGNGLTFTINDATKNFIFSADNQDAIFSLTDVQQFAVQKTLTPAGTTGNQTINKPFGAVNFAAGASDIIVSNSTAISTSLIFCTVQSLDTTAVSCRVTDRAAGSFHLRVPIATAEMTVAFWVIR